MHPVRHGRTAIVLALVLASAALLATPSTGLAAKHKLPRGFFGTVLDPEPSVFVSQAELTKQFRRMHKAGIESTRVTFRWAVLNPARGKYNWTESDRLVRSAATARVGLLPIVMLTPPWAARGGSGLSTNKPPAHYSDYANFMRALVKRYGPKGTFFRGTGVPKRPVRQWQIWNEPMQKYFWQTTGAWWKSYGPMLRAAHKAVHRADKHAVVVTAGLSGSAAGPSWDDLAHIYSAGGRGSFDAVAVNQYTNAEGSKFTTGKATSVLSSVNHLFQVAWFVRHTMRMHHDSSPKPIYLTEFGWPAAYGHLKASKYTGLETTPHGAQVRMTSFVSRLARNVRFPHPYGNSFRSPRTRSLNVSRAYWYTWASGFEASTTGTPWAWAGLNSWTPGQPFVARGSLLKTFTSLAKRY